MEQAPDAVFEAIYDSGVTGLVPGIEVAINDNEGNTVFGPTASGIIEIVIAGSGTAIYACDALVAPHDQGQYSIVWSNDGTFLPDHGVGAEDLLVQITGAEDVPILSPDLGGVSVGPCSAWTTSVEIADCCGSASELIGTMTSLLDDARDTASQVLFELSGRRFSGLCLKVGYRPCRNGIECGCMASPQVLSRGHLVTWDWGTGFWSCGGDLCGCTPLSEVKLSGYPVRAIAQVKVGGEIVDPSLYRLDRKRLLVRKDGGRWPACARNDLDDNQPGTFSVNYLFGASVPWAGKQAANQLACEIFKSCAGSGSGECALPTGVTRVTRQGITFERAFFSRDTQTGAWRTGLALVDMFLNTYNPNGIPRRATFYSASPRRSKYGRVAG
jgi:hypothetical protein